MTTEELIALIELRHKLKREISEEEFQDIRPLKSDPEKYDIDIVDGKLLNDIRHVYMTIFVMMLNIIVNVLEII